MSIYSHSKLSTFEQCPGKFKLRYLDKIKPPIESSIESHLGSSVHSALEWLYIEVKKNKLPSLDELIVYYVSIWEKEFKENFVIVKKNLTAKDYFNKGVKFLIDYYSRYSPFEENTLELEKKISLELDAEGKYKLIGYIDRLVYNLETGEYEVHDYKTANSMPNKEKFENDRQLALYSIAIKNEFGQDKRVCLIWYYLAHDQKICSYRSDEQLKELKETTIDLIKKIESTKEFPFEKSILCDWCEYKSICPAWNKEKPKNKDQTNLNNFPTAKKYIKN